MASKPYSIKQFSPQTLPQIDYMLTELYRLVGTGNVGPSSTGATGATGASGTTTVIVRAGTPGIDGEQGDPGDPGPPGPAGAAGPTGPTGASGAAGSGNGGGGSTVWMPIDEGNDPEPFLVLAASGATGATGVTGPTGPTGPTGASGASSYTIFTNTDTGTKNDWIPTGSTGVSSLIEWSGTGDLTVTGLASGTSGQSFFFKNISAANNAFFNHASTGSATGDRLVNMVTSAATPVGIGGIIQYAWDGTNWKIIGHNQGAAISFATVAGGVSATTVKQMTYTVVGRKIYGFYNIDGTSNNTFFSATIPYNVTGTLDGRYDIIPAFQFDNGVALSVPGRLSFDGNNSVGSSGFNLYTNLASQGWTASNEKISRGGFTAELV